MRACTRCPVPLPLYLTGGPRPPGFRVVMGLDFYQAYKGKIRRRVASKVEHVQLVSSC